MPARSVESSPGHRVMEFTCEDCGAPAIAGVDCDLREALRTGDATKAGRWYCGLDGVNPQCIGKGRAAPADLLESAAA